MSARKLVLGIVYVVLLVVALLSFSNLALRYVVWGYIFPLAISATIGDHKGRWALGLVLGVVLSWIGVIIMLIVPQAKTTDTHMECPHCKELMRRDATVCPHCQRDINPLP